MTGRIKHWFRQVKHWPSWLFWPPAMLIRLYLLFMRREPHDPNHPVDLERFPWITVVWHNRLLFYPLMFTRGVRCRTVGVVSASRDGQYMADLLHAVGVGSVRGSSSKQGAAALRGAMVSLRRGKIICITPDGPRGPRYRMSMGPVALASHTGIPVVPMGVNSSSYWVLRTWDRFQVPKPFAKVVLTIGQPIAIPPKLTEAEMEQWRQLLEQRLNEINGVTL